jgi:type VI secretion system secreted protein VgrG
MFSSLTQKNRFLKLTSSLGPDTLIPLNFSGTEEISRPFRYKIHTISSKLDLQPDDLLHEKMKLEIHTNPANPRYFNGMVESFEAGTISNGMRAYEITLVPWLSFLSYTTDCRIFLNKSVLEIFETLCSERGFHHFEMAGVKKKPPVREQCTQFRESTLAFIQRLLEEEGIFYFFRQTKDKHIMVLADQPAIHQPCPEPNIIFTADNVRGQQYYIDSWKRDYQFYSGKYTHTDYNYETSHLGLRTENEKACKLPVAKQYETYDYPGGHDVCEHGRKLADSRFQAEQVEHNMITGASNHVDFAAGFYFKLTSHPSEKELEEYVLTRVTHAARDYSYLSGTSSASSDSQEYTNKFSCIPRMTPYRPQQLTPKPMIVGPQTAVVVGPEGEEISTDKYGRIKVRFHWVRKDSKYKGDLQSCWARVAQTWAGNGYGAWFLPRIGHEVVVQFVDGDPDQPLVVGCVYNSNREIPFSQPANKTQSGIKTRSSKGGSKDNANELRFEDKKGTEEIFIHAEKDFNQEVENDLTITVDHDYIHETKHDEKHTIGNDLTHETKHNVTANVGKDLTHQTGNDVSIDVGNDLAQTIGRNLDIDIGNSAVIEAAYSIIFKVGTSTIELQPDQVLINGEDIWLNDKLVIINSLPKKGVKKNGK